MKDKKGRAIQICGTGSGVGKSVITAGLCRVFLQDGFNVAPFKAQNMALNSFVTKTGGEIGRAQAVQAQASRLEPAVDMNPVLIKPASDTGAQVIVLGKPLKNMEASQYIKHKSRLIKTVHGSFDRLIDTHDIVVIEGAGSPAEVNLRSHDFVNMKMAEYAKAPVILVCDIDKGGALAWVVGTLELLTEKERSMVKGIIINKFRGDVNLLMPGIKFLEKRTGVKVLGVVPYFRDVRIPEEDSVPLETTGNVGAGPRACPDVGVIPKSSKKINIAVIYLPHISNFTDFDPLEREPDVLLRYVRRPEELGRPDVIVIPGTKNTIGDLQYLRESGFAQKILVTYGLKLVTIFGVCGGYQMLGEKISDRHSLESNLKEIDGLGILPVKTNLAKEKVLTQVKGKEILSGLEVRGYEIHHGNTQKTKSMAPFIRITARNNKKAGYFDGVVTDDGRVMGTYIHGVFDNDAFRRNFINGIRAGKGWRPLAQKTVFDTDKEFDKLAKVLRDSIKMELVYKMMDLR